MRLLQKKRIFLQYSQLSETYTVCIKTEVEDRNRAMAMTCVTS